MHTFQYVSKKWWKLHTVNSHFNEEFFNNVNNSAQWISDTSMKPHIESTSHAGAFTWHVGGNTHKVTAFRCTLYVDLETMKPVTKLLSTLMWYILCIYVYINVVIIAYEQLKWKKTTSLLASQESRTLTTDKYFVYRLKSLFSQKINVWRCNYFSDIKCKLMIT